MYISVTFIRVVVSFAGVFFFFSSRRRHTRCSRDWSSDVCSSDLMAVNRYQLEDMAPYIYRTTDYGRTWRKIVSGIPATEFLRVVREDPVRRGVFFPGTGRGGGGSVCDGSRGWSPARQPPGSPGPRALGQGGG